MNRSSSLASCSSQGLFVVVCSDAILASLWISWELRLLKSTEDCLTHLYPVSQPTWQGTHFHYTQSTNHDYGNRVNIDLMILYSCRRDTVLSSCSTHKALAIEIQFNGISLHHFPTGQTFLVACWVDHSDQILQLLLSCGIIGVIV